MTTKLIIFIIIIHFIADFVLQSDEMALKKSSSLKWLTIHVIVYCGTFLVSSFVFIGGIEIYLWVLVNGILHWITDYLTSRWTAKLWKQQQRHWFFVVIGLDQVIHYLCLILTYEKIVS